MKKLNLVVLCIVLFSVLPVFGGVGKLSFGSFYDFQRIDSVIVEDVQLNTDFKSGSLGWYVKGTTFFSPSGNLGLSYMVRSGKTVTMESGDSQVELEDEPMLWDFSVGAAFQQPITQKMILELAAMLMYESDSEVLFASESSRVDVSMLSITALAELNYRLGDRVLLTTGLQASIPLSTTIGLSIGNTTLSQQYKVKGMTFTPSIGVSLAF